LDLLSIRAIAHIIIVIFSFASSILFAMSRFVRMLRVSVFPPPSTDECYFTSLKGDLVFGILYSGYLGYGYEVMSSYFHICKYFYEIGCQLEWLVPVTVSLNYI
jgi:hypothetical protein